VPLQCEIGKKKKQKKRNKTTSLMQKMQAGAERQAKPKDYLFWSQIGSETIGGWSTQTRWVCQMGDC